MSTNDWREFLTRFSHLLLQEPDIAADLPPEVVASGWLGYPGATEEQLAAAEARLRTSLPPSYRSFLAVTNGWRHASSSIYRLWSTEEIEWFSVRNQDWIDAYVGTSEDLASLPDEEYFVYGEKQYALVFRPEYLQTALEISDVGDSAIYLLNPQVITTDGEWEAWFLANWLSGARRYRSFRELIQANYRYMARSISGELDRELRAKAQAIARQLGLDTGAA